MNLFSTIGCLLMGCLLVWGCGSPPEFPNEPKIEFESITYKPKANNNFGSSDTLTISINFQDGDGDLGLDGGEFSDPYQPYFFFDKTKGEWVPNIPADPEKINDPNDYNACDYYIDENGSGDTLRVQLNKRHYNIIVQFFMDSGSGDFQEFDIRRDLGPYSCGTFDGRFFRLNADKKGRAMEGVLKYNMTSNVGFDAYFQAFRLILKVHILDRAGNESNTVETPAFTLNEITI
ncbi:hypothetical protein [Xanthovirga aplysinae]|uniref:hypothetical protein n=1 Tax=Xanthovirga aplysinae TaxID=2529853 RepID=UPI0012BB5608|nr:hypothetical protein [Xanthovirga aplysinae]MTI31405.1 hypothetical protein [Xanthovirga aplysinae]